MTTWENNKKIVEIAKTTTRHFIEVYFLEHFIFDYGVQRRNIMMVESRNPWNLLHRESFLSLPSDST